MAATVQPWLARSAASAPQVILTISGRGKVLIIDLISLDMAGPHWIGGKRQL
jgi:hypothetical protein